MRTVTSDLRAVVVDGHPIMRSGIVEALTCGGFDVVAHGARVADVLRPARTGIDVIVAGWNGDGRRDIEGLKQLLAAEPKTKLVVLAPAPERAESYRAFAAGASALILKTVHPDDLAPLVRQIVEGNVVGTPLREEPEQASSLGLTTREKQVLSWVASGANNAAVAAQLWLSEATVKFHLRNIYRKLGANGRTEAAARARELGLLPPSPAC